MTDAKGREIMKMMNYDFAKLTVLSANTAHGYARRRSQRNC
jgi:hypothetical protein